VRALGGDASDTKVPIRGIERMMVKSMTEALKVPHLTYAEEIVMDGLMAVRKDLNNMFVLTAPAGEKPLRMSFMPLLIKAASMALLQFPQLNATINSEVTEVTHHGNHNFGIAMDTPKGLIVPVVKQVQNMSVVEIARELAYLQDCASRGTLTSAQMSGGTFSLSNIGSIGGTYMGPVIVVPQVVIGALGRFQTVPKYVHKSTGALAAMDEIYAAQDSDTGGIIVSPRTIMNVSWAADHRVVDGASVSRYVLGQVYLVYCHVLLLS
jgi:2-oxoisovalerate dehydrogenase E2 component (dihydrolipoyl transacylase)